MKQVEKGRKEHCIHHLTTVREKEMHVYWQKPKEIQHNVNSD